jgi:Spy/CpxP family protein refolding chaperone
VRSISRNEIKKKAPASITRQRQLIEQKATINPNKQLIRGINMKRLLTLFIALSTIFAAESLMAQKSGQRGWNQSDARPGYGMQQSQNNGPRIFAVISDLTEAQKEEITTLHTKTIKAVQPHQDNMAKLGIDKRAAMRADNPSQKEINKLIEKMSDERVAIQKLRAENHLNIRNVLTADQKVVFDTKMHRRGGQNGPGMKGNRGGKRANCIYN